MAPEPLPHPRATPTALLAGLSHALDLTEGHPRGHAERACAIGLRLAELIGLTDDVRADLMQATLLKDAGCSSNAARVYEMFGGPEHGVKRAVWEADWRKIGPRLLYALRWAERGGSPLARFRRLASLAAMGPHGGRELFQIRCARGAEIATRIGPSADAAQAIHDMDEHWDGGGHPRGLRGDEIPLLARLMGMAQVMEIFWGHRRAARRRRRRGRPRRHLVPASTRRSGPIARPQPHALGRTFERRHGPRAGRDHDHGNVAGE
jgi:hypothetical protein